MGKAIVHEDGIFFEWSTVVDAPVTPAMTREEMRAYLIDQYGRTSEPDERLDRAVANGTSFRHGLTKERLAAFNRAGPNEEQLSWEEIIAAVKQP